MWDSHLPEDFAAMQPAYTGEVSIAEQVMLRLLPFFGWVAAFVELACKTLSGATAVLRTRSMNSSPVCILR